MTSSGDRNRKSVLDPDNPQSDFDRVVNAHQIFVRCRFSLHKSLRLMDQISMRFGSVADVLQTALQLLFSTRSESNFSASNCFY